MPKDHSSPTQAPLAIDALVVGGGIAGLWILDTLRQAGRSALLVEAAELGAGQSICAQGIIHGGLKYALGGVAGEDARKIAMMPETWRGFLAQTFPGEDLLLSPHTWLWRSDTLRSKIGLLGARLGLQTRPEPVSGEERPPLLRTAPGTVLRVPEPVVDVAGVLGALAQRNAEAIIRIDGPEGLECTASDGRVSEAILHAGSETIRLAPEHVILTAGRGNAALRSGLGLDPGCMQLRPLHMVVMTGALPSFHGHCIDGNRTRVTITSGAVDTDGRVSWQLGGEIAEKGVAMDAETLVAHARDELAQVLPDLPLEEVAFETYQVDRAEETTARGSRPEDISVIEDASGHTLTCWPTKLALAPRLAGEILGRVSANHAPDTLANLGCALPRPAVAIHPWEKATS